jgi:hypothetical protein
VRKATALLCLAASGCAAPTGVPAWAVDPIWLEPAGDEAVFGFQSWELFGEGWTSGYGAQHYVCAVVVRLDGTASTPCPECDAAWTFSTRLVETDCADEHVSAERFLALERVGLGPLPVGLEGDTPHPGQTASAYADYGRGWEPYGFGWPAALDAGEAVAGDGAWDGVEPFQLRPNLLWDLAE